jgi:hypothetical protein
MEEVCCKRFIDYSKDEGQFYDNLYFDDYNLVIKLPLIEKTDKKRDVKFKRFSLKNTVYLTSL